MSDEFLSLETLLLMYWWFPLKDRYGSGRALDFIAELRYEENE